MPLFLSGIVAITRVDKDASGKHNRFKTIALMLTTEANFVEATVNVWVDYDRGVAMPYINAVFMLEGKLSFDASSKMFIVEATRLIEQPSNFEPFAPRITGTGTYQSKAGDDMLRFRAQCFASGCSTDRLLLTCKYQVPQYLNVVSKMLAGKEMSVTGVLDSINEERAEMQLTYTDYSFLSRTTNSDGANQKQPKQWPLKVMNSATPVSSKKHKSPVTSPAPAATPSPPSTVTPETSITSATQFLPDDQDWDANPTSKQEPVWPMSTSSDLIDIEQCEPQPDDEDEIIRPRSKRARRDA